MTSKEAFKRIENTLSVGLKDEVYIDDIALKINRELIVKDLDVLYELVDRDTPKKVIRDKNTSVISAYCPKCNRVVDSGQIGCPYCLQRLNWS